MAKKRSTEKDAYDLCIEALERGDVAEAQIQVRKIQLHAMQRIAEDQIAAVSAINAALASGDFARVPEHYAPLADPLRKVMQEKLRVAMNPPEQPTVFPASEADDSASMSEQLTDEVA